MDDRHSPRDRPNQRQGDAIERLLEAVPEFRATYEQEVDKHYARGLSHVVFGSLFVDFVRGLQEKVSQRPAPALVDQLLRAFALIEEMASSEDFETRCIVEASVLESLLGEKHGWDRFSSYFGLATTNMARCVVTRFSGRE